MSELNSNSLDVLGIKPIGDAVSHASQVTIDGATSFLAKICMPAAEEFGLLVQDKVKVWRANNAVRVVAEAQRLLPGRVSDLHAHPRLVSAIIENGSWSDDVDIQKVWGGLLASSCGVDGRDDSNLVFVGLLGHLTSLQVRVLVYACTHCDKRVNSLGLIGPRGQLLTDEEQLKRIAGSTDIHRIDRELDHLRSLDLLHSGIEMESGSIDLAPTPLALYLYTRCNGFNGSPVEFFCVQTDTPPAQPA